MVERLLHLWLAAALSEGNMALVALGLALAVAASAEIQPAVHDATFGAGRFSPA